MRRPLLLVLAGCASYGAFAAELVVSPDGSGQFKTVQAAVDFAPPHSAIHIKPGVYKERVTVPPGKSQLLLRGDDPNTTIITFDLHAGLPGPARPLITFDTPTVFIQANDFTAENLTFENSAGPQGQAVALTIMGDRGVFRNCRFLGYQDTLLAQAGRQYFDRCYIAGAVDFIFGGSAAWFENCEIHVTANGYITAANTPKDQRYGYVLSHCRITGEPGARTYLGRPWRPYAATAFLYTEMSANVRPEGWDNWRDPAREKTARYAEYRSTGPGADPAARVAWAHFLSGAEAAQLTAETVLSGTDGWNPRTGAVKSAVAVSPGDAKPARIAKGAVLIATAAAPSGLRLATSSDGLKWTLITRTLLAEPIEDPRLVEGPDGIFHLVWATGRKQLGYANSRDLVHWSPPKYFEPMANLDALDLASPNLFYDAPGRRFIVTWASTMAKNFIQAFQEDVENNPRIWYAATRDFETLSEPAPLFDNNYSVRDAAILRDGSRYLLMHNDNTRPMLTLRAAWSETPLGPWGPSSDPFAPKFSESPSAVRLGDEWWIYYANRQGVALLITRDFRKFTAASRAIPFPGGSHPGSVLVVPRLLLHAIAPGI
ncbi:MAG TPA: pectinesterase family protein [Bryobacteraceae bacterium]|nr:pectinesterase family protein [Bryobacteraceae bacterium]